MPSPKEEGRTHGGRAVQGQPTANREEVAHVIRQPAGTSDGGFSDTKHIATPIAPRVVANEA